MTSCTEDEISKIISEFNNLKATCIDSIPLKTLQKQNTSIIIWQIM